LYHYLKWNPKVRIAAKYKFLSIVIILLVFILLNVFHIQLNYTSSMPIGFYRRVVVTNITRGDLVAVCLPKQIAAIALQRGYLSAGHCPSKVIPVLKQVIAIPGDTVMLTNSEIAVNGLVYAAPFMPTDHKKKLLQKFVTSGLYQHTDGYWIYGANDPVKSWDSRYYGGVDRKTIIGVYKPLLTFNSKAFVKLDPLLVTH
jgi:conjugative transfer signal peptidase TraF